MMTILPRVGADSGHWAMVVFNEAEFRGPDRMEDSRPVRARLAQNCDIDYKYLYRCIDFGDP